MKPTKNQFPVFEANQVLTNVHLNDIFNYLNEQERLTRANLIGIGIVCGLEIRLETTGANVTIHVTKGCGVTSEGYLIVEPEDVALVSYRSYTQPNDLDYQPFKNKNTNPQSQYSLWEMFTAGEPDTTPLSNPTDFLKDKAVVFFLELRKEGLRNCSPNNCDDKGAQVIATIRRLLIKVDDLTHIIAAANQLKPDLTFSDLEAAMLVRLNLPDLRLPRFDAPNTNPATSNDIFAAFLDVFRANKLALSTANALSAAYNAFKPLLQDVYPIDPFSDFKTNFGFLDQVPLTTDQMRFLQYYYDCFDDLLRAYDEFRWKGIELVCACCPPENLFPRHLMLGLLYPQRLDQPGVYRQDFLGSPALGMCVERSKEVLQLFRRLVEMTRCFSNTPSLPKANTKAVIDPQIRITPSTLGSKPLSSKAIPYYFQQNGTPPLYRLWSFEKTRRNRDNQNLSYHFDEYSPAAPAYVSNPLRYDLEPLNFLRIEGHLGKNYQNVLRTLLILKSQYRLPIEILAIRSSIYDDTQAVDMSKEFARFQDLEALYDSMREELLTTLTEGVRDLYNFTVQGSQLPAGTPQHPLLKTYAPNYPYTAGSVGAWYEKYLAQLQSRPYIDVDQSHIDNNAVLNVYCSLFSGTSAGSDELPNNYYPHVVSIYYFTKLSEILPVALDALTYADFENKYQDLLSLVRYFRSDAIRNISKELQTFIPQEELIDHFDEVLFSCKLNPIKSIHDEYVRRIGELKKKQFLANFLQHHPGIQHKAGVPLGGTFIIVYHQDPAPKRILDQSANINVAKVAEDTKSTALINKINMASSMSDTATTTNLGNLTKNLDNLKVAAISDAATSNIQILNSNIENVAGDTKSTVLLSKQSIAPVMSDTTTTTNQDSLKVSTILDTAVPNIQKFSDAVNRIKDNESLVINPDIGFVIDSLLGQVPGIMINPTSLGLGDEVSNIISKAVNELEDGTVIADFYLPYLISSDYVAAQFVLPKMPPTFSVDIGCSNADGSMVTVKAQGGVSPYDIKIDDRDYRSLDDTVHLNVGSHTLTIRDAENTESAPQTVTIAPPITFGEPTFKCSEDSKTYQATLLISGGNPPYTVNGMHVDGNSYTTHPIASGTKGAVEVMDSHQCMGKMEFTHACCTLPCKGIALRRGYRFPLPVLPTITLGFSFEFPQGSTIDLSEKIQQILLDVAGDADSFANKINSLIAETTGRSDWLKIAHDPSQLGIMDTWWIEYFECLQFKFMATWPNNLRAIVPVTNITITPLDSKIVVTEKEEILSDVTIPAFDGTKIDKCHPQTPVQTLCAEAPDLKLSIDKKQDGKTVVASVTSAGNDKAVAYLWEVQDSNPAMTNQQNATFTFASAGSKLLRVTAFTSGGCRVVQEDKIMIQDVIK